MKMKRGQRYWRGSGPIFLVMGVTDKGADLIAETSVTGLYLEVFARSDLGWIGPLDQQEISTITKDQNLQAAGYRKERLAAEKRRF